MTTPNSIAATIPNGQPAALNPASVYDIQDPPFTVTIPDNLFPSVPATTQTASPPAPVPAQTPVGGTNTPSPTPQPAASPAPAPKHPQWVLQHAVDFGLHPLIIDRLPTDELTQLIMETMGKARREQAINQVAATVTNPQQVAAAVTQPVAPPQPEFDWGVHDDTDDRGQPIKKKFTDSDVHPAVGSHIKLLYKKINELETHIQGMHQSAAMSVEQQRQAAFDAAFNKIGGIFGVGTANTLKGKPEFERRGTVYAAVKGMYASLPPAVRDQMSIEKAVNSMAKSLFNVDPPAAAATPQANGVPTPDQFVTGAIQPPTQRRNPAGPLGRDQAVDAAQAWLKEQQASGGIPAGGGTSMDEFLP